MKKQKKEKIYININSNPKTPAKAVASLTSGKFGVYTIWIVWIIILGIVALALSTIFDERTTILLSTFEHNGIKLWKIDIWKYLTNLAISLSPDNLSLNIPTINNSSIITITITSINYIIMMINILTYPLRISGFITINLMALVGINMNPNITHNLSWLINLGKFFTELNIPYIPNE
ncbi:MAG: hypothetical protein GX641_03775 [Mollicutes bacterium]|nr:hypothetical protein [Mollicutes bacterium]